MNSTVHWLVRSLCLTIAALWCLTAAAGPATAQTRVLRWHEDLSAAAKLARESGKPLFVVFRCVR